MFPDSSREASEKPSQPSKKLIFIFGGFMALCLVAIVILFFATNGLSSVTIPKNITQNAKSPIYLPGRLPGKYKIDESSFKMVEEGDVLVFEAKDGTSSRLIFSEQPNPSDFNFESFYKDQLRETSTLNDTPYSSVWGKSGDGRLTLSVVTEDTWILMVTSAPLGQDDMSRIAKGIQKQ